MKFIKENLFLVGLALATIVLAAVTMVMARKYSAGAAKGASVRTDLSRQLSSLAKGTFANRDVVDAEAEKVRLAREAVAKAKEGLIERNRGQYSVMSFVADGKVHPAFPIDKDLYAKVGAEYKIAQAYQDELDKLLKRLDPVEAPTAAEIDEAIRPEDPTGLTAASPVRPRGGLAAARSAGSPVGGSALSAASALAAARSAGSPMTGSSYAGRPLPAARRKQRT